MLLGCLKFQDICSSLFCFLVVLCFDVSCKKKLEKISFFGGGLPVCKALNFFGLLFQKFIGLLKGNLKVVFLFVCVDLMFPKE